MEMILMLVNIKIKCCQQIACRICRFIKPTTHKQEFGFAKALKNGYVINIRLIAVQQIKQQS